MTGNAGVWEPKLPFQKKKWVSLAVSRSEIEDYVLEDKLTATLLAKLWAHSSGG